MNLDRFIQPGDAVVVLRTGGGAGSGNFGHAGRPGEVGGSSGVPGGGSHAFADFDPARAYIESTRPFFKEQTDERFEKPASEVQKQKLISTFRMIANALRDPEIGVAIYDTLGGVHPSTIERKLEELYNGTDYFTGGKGNTDRSVPEPETKQRAAEENPLKTAIERLLAAIRDPSTSVFTQQLLHDAVAAGSWDAFLATLKARSAESYSYASTQVQLPRHIASQLFAYGRSIPDSDLAADGRETDAHVTVRYGLLDSDPEKLLSVLAGKGAAELTFGPSRVFATDDYDVVVIGINSPDLAALHTAISTAIPCRENDYDTYVPHATVAYVKPGRGARYAGWTGMNGETFTADSLMLCDTDGRKTEFSLKGLGLRVAFDPGQPRDETGKWTTIGGHEYDYDREAMLKRVENRRDRLPFPSSQAQKIAGPQNPDPHAELPPQFRNSKEDPSDATIDGKPVNSLAQPVLVQADEEESLGYGGNTTNEVLRLTTPDGDVVFKPEGEESLQIPESYREPDDPTEWQRDDITNTAAPLGEREVLAYRVDKELGLGLVPKTVYGEYEGRKGSVQSFVENASDAAYTPSNEEDAARMAVLDAVIGNQDRKQTGNALVTDEGKLVAIDHGLSFGTTRPGGWIRSWALLGVAPEALPIDQQKTLAKKLTSLDIAKIVKGSHLNDAEISAFRDRINVVASRLAAGRIEEIKYDFKTTIGFPEDGV